MTWRRRDSRTLSYHLKVSFVRMWEKIQPHIKSFCNFLKLSESQIFFFEPMSFWKLPLFKFSKLLKFWVRVELSSTGFLKFFKPWKSFLSFRKNSLIYCPSKKAYFVLSLWHFQENWTLKVSNLLKFVVFVWKLSPQHENN